MSHELRGTLKVSLPQEFGSDWLGKAVSEFALEFPDIRLKLDVNTEFTDLIAESYDVAIQFCKLKSSSFVCRPLATLSRALYASPDYIKRRGEPREIEDIAHHDCVVIETQQRQGIWSFQGPSKRRSIDVSNRATVNNVRLAREMVLGGVGLGILPEEMCARYVAANQLVRVLPSWRSPPLQATALVLAREGIPRKTRVFLDFIAQRLAQRQDCHPQPGMATRQRSTSYKASPRARIAVD
jgi:DNA-binding transcriptional LysR family regulator